MKKTPKYTILNLDFLEGRIIPRIDIKDIIGNDNITLRFTDQKLYEEAVNNFDLADNMIIAPEHKICDCICGCTRIAPPDSDLCTLCGPSIHGESKPKGPPNTIIEEKFDPVDIFLRILRKMKGWLP